MNGKVALWKALFPWITLSCPWHVRLRPSLWLYKRHHLFLMHRIKKQRYSLLILQRYRRIVIINSFFHDFLHSCANCNAVSISFCWLRLSPPHPTPDPDPESIRITNSLMNNLGQSIPDPLVQALSCMSGGSGNLTMQSRINPYHKFT